MPKFVGIGSQATVTPDGTTLEPKATLTFPCKTKPQKDAPYSMEVSVAFDIAEFCQTRLSGGTTKAGNPGTLSWYSHWKYADEAGTDIGREVIFTADKNPGPSVASEFRLTHLEQQCLRESQSYRDAVDGLPSDEFSDDAKKALKHFSASHGSSRNGTQTVAQKTEKLLAELQNHVRDIIIPAEIPVDEKSELADKIEHAAELAVKDCRKPLADYLKLRQEIAKAETALETAITELQEVVNNSTKFTKDEMVERISAKADAEQALAEMQAQASAEAQPEVDAEVDADSTASPETAETADSTEQAS